jgi:hypothetical protein
MRRSKSIDMRYHWIKDRVLQGQFDVQWQKDADNLADFFTKPLPASKHLTLLRKLVTVPPAIPPLIPSKRALRSQDWSNVKQTD